LALLAVGGVLTTVRRGAPGGAEPTRPARELGDLSCSCTKVAPLAVG
jgi:hypothetical protein